MGRSSTTYTTSNLGKHVHSIGAALLSDMLWQSFEGRGFDLWGGIDNVYAASELIRRCGSRPWTALWRAVLQMLHVRNWAAKSAH